MELLTRKRKQWRAKQFHKKKVEMKQDSARHKENKNSLTH